MKKETTSIDTLLLKDTLNKVDQIIFGLFENEKIPAVVAQLDKHLESSVAEILKKENFKGSAEKTLGFYFKHHSDLIKVLVVGLGKRSDLTREKIREVFGRAVMQSRAQRIKKAAFLFDSFLVSEKQFQGMAEAMTEAVELALYEFSHYKQKKSEVNGATSLEKIFLTVSKSQQNHLKEINLGIKNGAALATGVRIARDFINEPSNKMDPAIFARRASEMAKKYGLKIQILEKKDLEREKMGAILAVGQGSVIPPRLLVLTYQGRSTGAPIGLVGKGVTFDTGGISIKPSKGMEQMKYDMSGGAAVLGTLISAACLKLPLKLVGVIPVVENMPSGSAIKPGDVVHSAAGLSIEVINTDAEGRLILCDALHYIKRFKPKMVFDLATLTGAVNVVVGSRAMAAMGDSSLIQTLQKIGEEVNERVWELPMWPEYDDDVKSDVADLQNVGKGEAGTIMGAKFLEPFVGKAYPWVHLDIASTAWIEKKGPSYCPKGGRGVGVRLLIGLLRSL